VSKMVFNQTDPCNDISAEQIPGQLELFSAKAPRDDFEEVGNVIWNFEEALWERIQELGYEEYRDGIEDYEYEKVFDVLKESFAKRFELDDVTWDSLIQIQFYALRCSKSDLEVQENLLNILATLGAWLRHVKNR
jgi:hypothetical protein